MTITQTLPNGLSVRGINRNETEYLYKEIFEDRIYAPPGAFALPLRPVIFDIGANIGMFSLFASRTWPDARIYSFEPVPEVFGVLCENVAGLPNVTTVNTALGSAEESRQLTFYPRYTMMSGFDADPAVDKALVHSYIKNVASGLGDDRRGAVLIEEAEELLSGRFDEIRKVPCEVARIDVVAERLGVGRIDLLKIDVEGFEVEVLMGVGDKLWPNIGHAVVEVEDDNEELSAVTRLFTEHGMRTTIEQSDDYCGTSLFTLFASRAA